MVPGAPDQTTLFITTLPNQQAVMDKPIRLNRFLFNLLQRLMFVRVRTRVQNNTLDALGISADKPVVYVLQNRSLSDLLVLDRECQKAGLSRPCSSLTDQAISEKYACFSLTRPEGLVLTRDRTYHSARLVRLVKAVEANPDQDVQIVPVSVFWGRAPDKEDSPLKLLFAWNYNLGSRFRKFLAILLHGRQTLVHFSPALSLRNIVDGGQDHNRTLRKVGRILRVHFRQVRVSVLGPDLSHRRLLVNSIIHSDSVRKAIIKQVETRQMPLEQAKAMVRNHAREMVSDFSYPVIRFMDILLTWFWHRIYNGINVNHIEPIRDLAGNHALIYVPCHRSHIDYLLLSYVLYHGGLQPPHIAAGINLNMPLVGSLLRRSGAFFIRRSFQNNPLYTAVFHEYLHTLFVRGFPTEYFIEGSRSRTGRILHPKTGILSITLRSFLRNNRKPIAFVPVYIGYEKLLEVNTYLDELHGKSKKKESPLDIIRTVTGLKNNFGRVCVNFGEPILLDQFLDQVQPTWRTQDYANNPRPTWLRDTTNRLSVLIAGRINSAAAINPVNLVAMALLASPRHALGEPELVTQLEACQKLIARAPCSSYTTQPVGMSGQDMIRYVESMKMVYRQTDNLGDIIRMDDRNAVLMTYYRNNILHLFAIPSLISRILANGSTIEQQEVITLCRILYPYLKSELFLPWEVTALDDIITRWLSVMAETGLLTVDGTLLRHPEASSTEFITLIILSRPIQQTLERFYVVISLMRRNGSGNVNAKSLENQSRDMAQRLSVIHGLNAPEFFDKTLFRHFIEGLQDNGVVRMNDNHRLEFGKEVAAIAHEVHQVLPGDIRHSILQVTHASG